MKKILRSTFLFFVILAMTACSIKPAPAPTKPALESDKASQDNPTDNPSPTEDVTEPTQTGASSEPEPTEIPEDPIVEPTEGPATPETPRDPLSYLENVQEDPVGSRARVQTLKETLEDHLESWGYTFTFDDENVGFNLNFTLREGFEAAQVIVRLYYDMITVSAYPRDFTVPESSRDQMAYYTAMANLDNYYGFLIMDYETGDIFVRTTHVVEQAIPSEEDFDVLLHEAMNILERHGENLKGIAFNDLDPYEAYLNGSN